MSLVIHEPEGGVEVVLVRCGVGRQLAVVLERRTGCAGSPLIRVHKWRAKSRQWARPIWLHIEHDLAATFPSGSANTKKLATLLRQVRRAGGFEQLHY